jgi:uncharacterized membrane protein
VIRGSGNSEASGARPIAEPIRKKRAPGGRLRWFFWIGLALKSVDGTLEAICGVVLFFATKPKMNRLILWILGNELYEKPRDLFVKEALHLKQHMTSHSKDFAAAYLVGHGLVKIFLVVNLLRNRLWAYPVAIIVLVGFVGYQVFRICEHPSIAMAVLTSVDVAIILAICLEYRTQRDAAGSL